MAASALSNSGVLFTDRRDFYIKPNVVAELWPSVTPFSSMLLAKGARKVSDPDYKLFEHRSGFVKQEFSVNDGTLTTNYDTYLPGDIAVLAAVDTLVGFGSLSVGDDAMVGLTCEVWDSTKTTYKGVSHIRSNSSGALTCISLGNPRVSTNYHSALADNDVFIVIGNAFGEGTESPEAFGDQIEVVYNSAQIFKTPVEVTGTLYEAALRGYSNELARLRIEKQKENKFQIEKALLLGHRSKGTGMKSLSTGAVLGTDAHADTTVVDANSKTLRTTMGIISALYKYGTTAGDYKNIFNIVGSTYGWKDYIADTEKVFQFVPTTGRKVAYCGQGALSYWSSMSGSDGFVKKSGWSVQLSKSDMTGLGFAVRTLETPHGIIDLVYAPQLRGQYNNTMVVMDESNVELCEYRPMKFQANIKTDNAYDGIKDQYFYDAGLGITLIESHSIWNIV